MFSLAHKLTDNDRLVEAQRESFGLLNEIVHAKQLVTHQRADMDALFSVAMVLLLRRLKGLQPIPVSFVPGSQDIGKNVLALDMGPARGLRSTAGGGFSIKASHADGACCMAVLRTLAHAGFDEEYHALEMLVREISITDEDSQGRNTVQRVVDESLSNLRNTTEEKALVYKSLIKSKSQLICTSMFHMFGLLRAKYTDDELLRIVCDLVDEEVKFRKRKRNLPLDPFNGVEFLFGRKLAITPVGAGREVTEYLEKHGVDVTLYSCPISPNKDKWVLVLHKARNAVIDLEGLFSGRMDDFPNIAINGMLVGWGSKGGGLIANDLEIRRLRKQFIQRVVEVMGPWHMSRNH